MQHPACVFGRKGRSFSWEGPRLFGKTCLWGGLPQRRGLRVLLLAASLLEKTGASCGCTAKTLRPPSFLFFDRFRRFSLFFKRGARGISESPAAFRLDSGWAKRYNNTIKWESAFSPAPPLSRGIDRAGRHSFGIAAAGAACILIERKQGPEQNGTKPGRECPAAWE